jgi:hypothetical protein
MRELHCGYYELLAMPQSLVRDAIDLLNEQAAHATASATASPEAMTW